MLSAYTFKIMQISEKLISSGQILIFSNSLKSLKFSKNRQKPKA